jgi:hypothetical protein
MLNFLETMASNAANPTVVAGLNSVFVHDFGTGALLASAQYHDGNTPFDPANPVTTATHTLATGLDNCIVPKVIDDSEL